MKSVETIIDLTIDSSELTAKNVIHLNDFLTVKEKLSKLIPNDVGEIVKENDIEGYYKSIFVEGARGTGKTTFLKTVYQYYLDNDDIAVLDYFDPTLIENKASIFLTVISLIKKKVFVKLNSCPYKKTDLCDRKKWESCMENLSAGLSVVDEFSDNTSVPNYWDDDFMIMEKGLKSVSSAFELRNNFKKLVKISLEILNKKAFLLIIDDADTDCSKTFPLLETLRKYLCIKGFITIVSGNYDLFSLTLKTKYYSRFQSAKNYDLSIEKQVNELVEQYFRKVFPIQNRIVLKTLKMLEKSLIFNKNEPDGQRIVLRYMLSEKAEDLLPLSEYIRQAFFVFGINNPYQLSAYTDYIYNLPLRTQIDLFRFFRDFVYVGKDIYIKDEDLITQIFIEELSNQGIDLSLIRGFPQYLPSVILNFLLNKDELFDYYQLQPISNDVSFNGAIFSLNLLLSLYIRKYPELIFNYMIKIGFVRNISTLFTKKNEKDTVKYYYSLKGFVSNSALLYDTDLKPSMGNAIAYLRSMKRANFIESIPGVLELSNPKKNKLLKNASTIQSYIAKFPYSCSFYSNDTQVHEYSIFTLIGVVFDLLREYSKGVDISTLIIKLSQPRDYMMTFEKNPELVDTEKINENEKDVFLDVKESFSYRDFYDELTDWNEYIKRIRDFIPIHVLAKACTRMFYSISHVKVNSRINIEDTMQELILLFFNSLIIEEVLENNSWNQGHVVSIMMDNTSKTLEQNISICIKGQICEKLILSKIVISCPIFLEFIDLNQVKYVKDFLEELAKKDSRYATGEFQIKKYEDNTYSYLKQLFKSNSNNKNESEKSGKK